MFIAECKKDLLLIVDTSYSVGKNDFEKVKKFLINLVTDSRLNVGPAGTQVGLILFSSERRTRVKLQFGDKKDAQDLRRYINGLQWEKVKGDRTRTEKALKLAKGVRIHIGLFIAYSCSCCCCLLLSLLLVLLLFRAVARALIRGGGGYIHIFVFCLTNFF